VSDTYQFAAKPEYRLLQLTDCHLLADPHGVYQQIKPYQHLVTLLSALKKQHFDAVLLTGDLTQDHSVASYQLLADAFREWPSPVFYLPGNHDEPALMAQAFAQPPFCAATVLQASGWRWLLLNTKGPTPAGMFDASNQQQLVMHINNSPSSLWLFCHHHPVPIGAAIDVHGLQQPEGLLHLLENNEKVKGLAHGHCHYGYQAQHTSGLTIVGCPATSVQFTLTEEWYTEDLGPQGCIWTFAANGDVSWEFIRL
jgi:Icc protein